ncbi:hydroxyacid-oxoacid transhydrogenase [Halobellus salinisoli]|uniref:hydroxyacid-oxoacid transhydrogenase n=1 Tax=Halobellus salinisoli TaxID=3108500 RepID=UPI00300AFC30
MFDQETVWEFNMTDRVKFGSGASRELSAEAKQIGAETVLFVTDEGVVGAGIVDYLADRFGSKQVIVYDDVEPDPNIGLFEDALEFAAQVDPDLIIGVGGGSCIDVAKTTSVVIEHEGELIDYVAPPTGGGEPIRRSGVPMVAIPTTAGTGSETSPVSVISLPSKNLKVGISSQFQYPDLAVIDPELTVTLPSGPTAASGMDALCHAIEAYTTRGFGSKARPEDPAMRPDYGGRTTVTDAFALKAIELVSGNLRQAVNVGEDLDARRNMSLASFLAGVAFTNAGLGATHALALSAAGEYGTGHGVTIATLLPEVMRFNAGAAADRYADVYERLASTEESLPADPAEGAIREVTALADDIGIPEGLSDLGVESEYLTSLAEGTMQLERLLVGNPRRLSVEDAKAILTDAY